MILKQAGVVIVPITVVLVLGSFLWQNDGLPDSNYPCALTESNAEGPYYIPHAPQKEKLGATLNGQKLIISGQVLDYNCNPIPDAIIDIWQTDSDGKYYFDNFILRGKIYADSNGEYSIQTIFPGKYSESGTFRPAHLHVKVSSSDGELLTTQLYFAGDKHHDWLVKPSLILETNEINGIYYSEFDFVVSPKI